jgi:hypothetical protein
VLIEKFRHGQLVGTAGKFAGKFETSHVPILLHVHVPWSFGGNAHPNIVLGYFILASRASGTTGLGFLHNKLQNKTNKYVRRAVSVHGAQFLSLLLFCFRGDTQHTTTTTKATGTQRIIKSMGKTYFKGIFRHRQKGFVKKNAKLATDNVVVGNDDEFRSLQSCIRACIMDACIIMGERFNGLR